MEIEVLLSCMNQDDYTIVEDIKLNTDIVIINQSNKKSYAERVFNHNNLKYVTTNDRGLSKSRNLALSYASNEICVLCDDDVSYVDNYKEIILNAFKKLPSADIIIFDINRIGHDRIIKPMRKIRKAPRFKSYGSVRIAFKLEKIKLNNIRFNENFGSGSIYSSGEETIFLNESRKKKLHIYEYPEVIANVNFESSSWREGYNEKFYYDKGALLAAAYPNLKHVFMFYYIIKLSRGSKLTLKEIVKFLLSGMKNYPEKISYKEYLVRNK